MPLFHATRLPLLLGGSVAIPDPPRDEEVVISSPADISDLWSWVDMDQQTEADGADIGTLVDRSGNSRDWAKTTSGSDAVMRRNAFGAHSAAEFDDASAFSGPSSPPEVSTVVVVYSQPVSTAGIARRVLKGANNWLIGPYDNYHRHYAGSDFLTGPQVVPTAIAAVGLRTHPFTALGAPASWRNWLYHNTAAASNAQAAPDSPGSNYFLGAAGAYPSETFAGGFLLAVAVYNRQLTFLEFQRLNVYYATKYSLARQEVYVDDMESYTAGTLANGKRGYLGLPWNDKAWAARTNA